MENEQNKTTKVESSLLKNKKLFIGLLLSVSGVIFFLAGIMTFLALMVGIYTQLAIFIVFIIAPLIVGIISFGIGSFLMGKE